MSQRYYTLRSVTHYPRTTAVPASAEAKLRSMHPYRWSCLSPPVLQIVQNKEQCIEQAELRTAYLVPHKIQPICRLITWNDDPLLVSGCCVGCCVGCTIFGLVASRPVGRGVPGNSPWDGAGGVLSRRRICRKISWNKTSKTCGRRHQVHSNGRSTRNGQFP